MTQRSGLFSAVKLGSLELPNRIVMSPMTRIRAEENCVPTEGYSQYTRLRFDLAFAGIDLQAMSGKGINSL